MKNLLLLSLLVSYSISINAKEVRGHFMSKDYDSGIQNANKLVFEGESTKMGLITTKWDGIVKDFSVVLEEEGNAVKAINLSFPISSMDTDNKSRNEKMQKMCLEEDKYKDINVRIPGPVTVDGVSREYQGTILVRGKEKPVKVNLSANKIGEKIIASGNAKMSFKDLEIPDPSIMIAKVADTITIIFAVEIQ